MTIYSLYVKTHKKTGLKYLGQTSKDPIKYCGSGIDWKEHLIKFGPEVHTEILLQTDNKEDRNYWGRHYSTLWAVVGAMDNFGNKIWANRILETGGGGPNSGNKGKKYKRRMELGIYRKYAPRKTRGIKRLRLHCVHCRKDVDVANINRYHGVGKCLPL